MQEAAEWTGSHRSRRRPAAAAAMTRCDSGDRQMTHPAKHADVLPRPAKSARHIKAVSRLAECNGTLGDSRDRQGVVLTNPDQDPARIRLWRGSELHRARPRRLPAQHVPGEPFVVMQPIIEVTLLPQARCIYSTWGKHLLGRVGQESPLQATGLDTAHGRDLATPYGIPFAPGILLDGRGLGYGRSQRRLHEAFTSRGSACAEA